MVTILIPRNIPILPPISERVSVKEVACIWVFSVWPISRKKTLIVRKFDLEYGNFTFWLKKREKWRRICSLERFGSAAPAPVKSRQLEAMKRSRLSDQLPRRYGCRRTVSSQWKQLLCVKYQFFFVSDARKVVFKTFKMFRSQNMTRNLLDMRNTPSGILFI